MLYDSYLYDLLFNFHFQFYFIDISRIIDIHINYPSVHATNFNFKHHQLLHRGNLIVVFLV